MIARYDLGMTCKPGAITYRDGKTGKLYTCVPKGDFVRWDELPAWIQRLLTESTPKKKSQEPTNG